MNTRLYTGISLYEFISVQFGRFACVVGFVYLLSHAYLQPEANVTEIGAAVLLSFLLPKQRANRDKTRPILFDLKKGGTVQYYTKLEKSKMKKIVDLVNSLIQPAPTVKKPQTKRP